MSGLYELYVFIHVLLISFPITWISPMLETPRKLLTSKQTKVLEEMFQVKPYIKPKDKHQLAKSLNISQISVENWFANKRSRSKKYGLLREGENCLVRYQQNYTHTCTHIHTNTHTNKHAPTHTHKHTHTNCTKCPHTVHSYL